MARFQVGEAFLQVVPSLSGLHKKIEREIKAMGPFEVDVVPRMDKFHEKIQREVDRIQEIEIDVTPNMAGFHEKVAAGTQNLGAVDVPIEPDFTGFNERVQEETNRYRDPIQVPFEPDFDGTKANAKVDAFTAEVRKKLETAIRALPAIELDANSDKVTRRIAQIRAELEAIQKTTLDADFDGGKALAQIKILEAELDALGKKTVDIKVKYDVSQASLALNKLRGTFADTDRDGNLLSRTLGSVGSGIGSMVSAVGSGIISLGSFAGETTSVGAALTSLGSKISGGGASLSTSLGSLGTSFGSLIASAAPMIAMFTLIGGAVSVAVAGIAQLGGAAIALVSGIVPLVGLLGTLPGLLAPIGIGIGALVIAFGDAGLKGALDGVKNAFQPVIDSLRNQMRPALTEFLGSIAQLAPTVQAALPAVTSALSDVVRGFSDIFKTSTFKADLQSIMTAAGDTIRGFGTAAQDVFRGVIDMMIAAQPAVTSLTSLIGEFASKFREAMAEGRASGSLAQFFQEGVDVLRGLLDLVGNLAGAFRDLWDSANRTGAFQAVLGALNDGITKFRDYVSQAGGSWDQLMAKAGTITQQILTLIGQIGDAFVKIGANVDLDGLFKGLGDALPGITDAIINMGNAFSTMVEKVGPVASKIAEAFGGGAADLIRTFGVAVEALGPAFSVIGPILSDVGESIMAVIKTLVVGVDTISTLVTAGWRLLQGDVKGAGDAFNGLGDRTKEIWGLLDEGKTKTAGAADGFKSLGTAAGEAKTGVNDLGTAVTGIPDSKTTTLNADAAKALTDATSLNQKVSEIPLVHSTTLNADAAQAISNVTAAQNVIKGLPQTWTTKFVGDTLDLAAKIGDVANGIGGVPLSHLTQFTGDTGNILSQSAGAQAAITAVPLNKQTFFQGDTSNILAASADATARINTVVPTFLTSFLGETGSVVAAAATSIAQINAVPPTHMTDLQGDAGNIIAQSATATSSINAIPPSYQTILLAVDNASRVAALVRAAYAQIPASVTTVITAIQKTVAGQAAGGILAPMAAGGVIGMAPGGSLSPMRGGLASIVPPNTFRIIGDRMRDLESYIPINGSDQSQKILALTARLMGQALVPEKWLPLLKLLAPVLGLASGRILATDDSGAATLYGTDPTIPVSNPRPWRRPRRPPEHRQPDVWSLFHGLLRRLVIPAIQQATPASTSTTQSLADAWQQQAATMAATVQQWHDGSGVGQALGGAGGRRGGLLDGRGHSQGPPPGWGSRYATPAQMDAVMTDQQWQFNSSALPQKPQPPNIFNIHPREGQSEESIAMAVGRRQAFTLRS